VYNQTHVYQYEYNQTHVYQYVYIKLMSISMSITSLFPITVSHTGPILGTDDGYDEFNN